MSDNFLPDFQPVITPGTKNTLQCLIRDKAVAKTPEELVRQRVLHWLIDSKGRTKNDLRLEQSYPWVSDRARKRVRTDLELLADGKVQVVVECKRADVPLGEHVDQQAKEYAVKARARWIWTTNGDSHRFLKRRRSTWRPVKSLEPLDVLSAPPVAKLDIPTNANDERAVARYWKAFGDTRFLEGHKGLSEDDCNFVLAVHRVLFDLPKKLPYSHGGVHILEDRGSAWHQFGNAGGGHYHTRYADFIAATQGRVEAVSVAVNLSGRGLRLCVGVRKPNRAHHALQLNTDKCKRDERTNSWRIHHDGRMSGIKTATVLEAVRKPKPVNGLKMTTTVPSGSAWDDFPTPKL